jgi:hypothetical protein
VTLPSKDIGQDLKTFLIVISVGRLLFSMGRSQRYYYILYKAQGQTLPSTSINDPIQRLSMSKAEKSCHRDRLTHDWLFLNPLYLRENTDSRMSSV